VTRSRVKPTGAMLHQASYLHCQESEDLHSVNKMEE
jgi:hypothetical protein